ncbi:hypothetical protein [Arsukibacterium sp.]|uniref:hypothetical protein n=1 Tax=Arsukibacterium sp. TaxID=1977258 RepID=UPI00299EDA37|nr:hypothetical protein [Arsukibacterium sp.]MDX1536971.1 hypothetical protein [Arsukibacterium sp.]
MTIIMPRNSSVFLALFASFSANVLAENRTNLIVAPSWGDPEFSQYEAPHQTSEWRYSRHNATLIITKAQCPKCKAISQQDIAELNQTGATAVMLQHQAGPAMLRLSISPKGQLLRTFQLNSAGIHYQFQLGINSTMPLVESFALEQEFLVMVNSFLVD